MFSNVANIIGNVLQPLVPQQVQPLRKTTASENPFAAPFMTVQDKRHISYGKNNPVNGGYFAGYHNGKQNIVGRKLFINV